MLGITKGLVQQRQLHFLPHLKKSNPQLPYWLAFAPLVQARRFTNRSNLTFESKAMRCRVENQRNLCDSSAVRYSKPIEQPQEQECVRQFQMLASTLNSYPNTIYKDIKAHTWLNHAVSQRFSNAYQVQTTLMHTQGKTEKGHRQNTESFDLVLSCQNPGTQPLQFKQNIKQLASLIKQEGYLMMFLKLPLNHQSPQCSDKPIEKETFNLPTREIVRQF